MPARTVAEKSRSGSASIRMRDAVAEREDDVDDRLGRGAQMQHALLLLRAQQLGQAARAWRRSSSANSAAISSLRRESVNSSKISVKKPGLVADDVVERRDEPRHEVVGRPRAAQAARRAAARRTSQSRRTTSTSSCSFVPK